jgi:hypothetical protein
MTIDRSRVAGCLRAALLLLALLSPPMAAWPAASGQPPSSDVEVMRAFTEAERPSGHEAISEQRKHLILFVLGVTLLVFILTTAVLGINMAIFGKRVFVAHTIFAGFTVTLAITHAVIALVWFFPF